MSDYDDRGAYTPPSDRLAFDPRQPVRGGGPAPVTLIVSGLVLVGMVGGVFFLYRDGFRHREAPALVGAPVADVHSPAAPPAANVAPDAGPPSGLVIDKTAAPAVALPPPPPAPPAPAVPAQPTLREATLPSEAGAPASPPVAARPVQPPQVVMLAPDAPPKPAARAVVQTAAAAPPKKVAETPRLADAAPAERPVVHHTASVTIASLTDGALAHHGRAARAAREDGAMREDGATREDGETHAIRQPSARLVDAEAPAAPPAHHRAVVAAHIKGAQYAAATPTRMVAGPSTGWVQIGAFSSPTLADQGWRDVARAEPDAMAGKGKAVQPLDRDDGATLYRTYVTGFASVSAAQTFCEALRASGKSCMVK